MPANANTPQAVAQNTNVRVRVFVDYWNFQLRLNELEPDGRFQLDWKKLGPWLSKKACETASIEASRAAYEGMAVYSSFDPNTEAGRKLRGWLTMWMDRQPGIDVSARERKAKMPPNCPSCHKPITHCPHEGCGKKMAGTVEKGVDTLLVTDMIRLAWEEAYDIAVLASLDADLVPAVEFLNLKGRKVIHAGFPPRGVHLASAYWGSFDVAKQRDEIRYIPKPKPAA